MIDADVLARSFDALVIVVALGLLWPLRWIWLFPVTIIVLGIAANVL